MRALVVVLLAAGLAAAQNGRPAGGLEVVRVERIYHLADGRALVIEETSDRPGAFADDDRALTEAAPPPPARRSTPPPPRPSTGQASAAAVRSAPEVAGRTFRGDGLHGGAVFNPSHTCPNCGYTSPANGATWQKRGQFPDGTHLHTCPKCATAWYH